MFETTNQFRLDPQNVEAQMLPASQLYWSPSSDIACGRGLLYLQRTQL